MNRVTDEQVIHSLAWASNYGDVEGWKRIAKSGPKWLIRFSFPEPMAFDYHGPMTPADFEDSADFLMAPRPEDIIPREMALTNREVLLMCYGLAIGGERTLSRHIYREAWDRGVNDPAEAVAQEIESRS